MFRRIRGNQEKEKIEALQGMGFSAYQAKQALAATNGNVERAADILLTEVPSSTTSSTTPAPAVSQDLLVTETEEQQLRRALEESRLASQTTQSRSTSAVTRKAGEAAAQRAANASKRFGANGVVLKSKEKSKTASKPISTKTSPRATFASSKATTQNLHPNIKLPAQMKDKTKEEQIVRCTQRLAPHFYAVDTLLQALLRIRDDPTNQKIRSIQTTSAGYKSALQDKPGAKDFLLAVNFQERYQGRTLELPSDQLDMALLFLGISALEQVRMTNEYKDAKRQNQFEKEVRRIQNGDGVKDPVEEEVKRANFIAKCPSAPAGGAGALMQVNLGSETLRRRFDGDDMLQDVIHWIGGSGSVIPEKILQRDWCLVDLNRYPVAPIDVEGNMDRTLQFVGCWPSGRLEIRPSTEEWKLNKTTEEKMGSSRGLGAAPSSTLN